MCYFWSGLERLLPTFTSNAAKVARILYRHTTGQDVGYEIEHFRHVAGVGKDLPSQSPGRLEWGAPGDGNPGGGAGTGVDKM